MSDQDLYNRAIQLLDEANSADPHQVREDQSLIAGEVLYAQRMSRWLEKLWPEAPLEVRLAARAQHICRWMIARDSYPKTRGGYLSWRMALQKFHAQKAGEILAKAGYGPNIIDRVASLVRKENLAGDPHTQMIEDAACLVFLENHFEEFSAGHDDQKIIGILKKTWRKMSSRAREAAAGLSFNARSARLLAQALGQ